MEAATVSAIISATAGITGVLLGNSFVAIKEYLGTKREETKDALYLAILVVAHLDRFVTGCLNVALDDGTDEGRPAGDNGEYHQATVRSPEFRPLDLQVAWKALPSELMYRILDIPYRQELVNAQVNDEWLFDDPPDYSEYFFVRQHEYAKLGLATAETAGLLRRHAGLPVFEVDQRPDAMLVSRLQDRIKEITDARAAKQARYEAAQKKLQAELAPPQNQS